MDKTAGILQMVIPVILMLAIGMLCRKKDIIHKQGIAGLKSLVVNICLPGVLIKAFYNATYNLDMLIIVAFMFAVCLTALGIGFAFKKAAKSNMRTTPFLMTGFEAGMLGYALYTLLFGADKVTYFATVDLGQVLFVFTVYLSLLNHNKTSSVKDSLKTIATSPIMISILTGLIIGLTGLGKFISASPFGGALDYLLGFISTPTAFIILLVVGYELQFDKENIKLTFSTILFRFFVMGLLCVLGLLAMNALIPVDENLKWSVILMFTLPPPFVLSIFVDDHNENRFVSTSLSAATLLSLIVFTFIAFQIA